MLGHTHCWPSSHLAAWALHSIQHVLKAGNRQQLNPSHSQSCVSLLQGNHLGKEGDKATLNVKVCFTKYFQISKPGIISNQHANLKFRICGTGGNVEWFLVSFIFLCTYDMMEKINWKIPFSKWKEIFLKCWKWVFPHHQQLFLGLFPT